MSDVTLVHEDDEKLEAHKVILAALSPFLQPQINSCSLKSILEIYLVFILRFILISCQQVDTKDLKWIRGHNYAPVSATWAIKYAPVYYTGLFWIRGYPTVQTAHCALKVLLTIQYPIHLSTSVRNLYQTEFFYQRKVEKDEHEGKYQSTSVNYSRICHFKNPIFLHL